MWEISKFRIRAHVRNRRLLEQKKQEQRQKFAGLHIKRIGAQIKLLEGFAKQSDVVEARLLINELTRFGVKIFSSQPFFPGQIIALTIPGYRQFYARAQVRVCNEVSRGGMILSENSFSYRLALEFLYESKYEQYDMEKTCRDIQHAYGAYPIEQVAGNEPKISS